MSKTELIKGLAKLISEGKGTEEVANYIVENAKVTDIKFGGRDGFNLGTLSAYFVVDSNITELGAGLMSKREAGSAIALRKNQEIFDEVMAETKKVKLDEPAYSLAGIIAEKDFGLGDETGTYSELNRKVAPIATMFKNLNIDNLYKMPTNIEQHPATAFLVQAFQYFDFCVGAKEISDGKGTKKINDYYNPITPFIATAILARTLVGTYNGPKNKAIDDLENIIETYMLAVIKRAENKLSERITSGKVYNGHNSASIQDIVADAIEMVDGVIEKTINPGLGEVDKITVKASDYLHDISLIRTKKENTFYASQTMIDMDEDAQAPLSYNKSAFIEPVFSEESDFVFDKTEKSIIKLLASGEKNKVRTALKLLQASIADVEIDEEGNVDSRFISDEKVLRFAVSATVLTEASGLARKNPELAEELAEAFADIYCKAGLGFTDNLSQFVKEEVAFASTIVNKEYESFDTNDKATYAYVTLNMSALTATEQTSVEPAVLEPEPSVESTVPSAMFAPIKKPDDTSLRLATHKAVRKSLVESASSVFTKVKNPESKAKVGLLYATLNLQFVKDMIKGKPLTEKKQKMFDSLDAFTQDVIRAIVAMNAEGIEDRKQQTQVAKEGATDIATRVKEYVTGKTSNPIPSSDDIEPEGE